MQGLERMGGVSVRAHMVQGIPQTSLWASDAVGVMRYLCRREAGGI